MSKISTNSGQVMMMVVVFAMLISLSLVMGMGVTIVHKAKIARDTVTSKENYFLAESLTEDIVYRLKRGKTVGTTESLTLSGNTATAVITNISASQKEVYSTGSIGSGIRRVYAKVSAATGASFFYGVQVGNGGLEMNNTSSVEGNVNSSGPVTGNGNIIRGGVVSAGPSGLIDNIHATSSAYAHTIRNSTVDANAYYQVISNTTVGGTSYPGSADPVAAALPIDDTLVAQWETEAAAGGTYSGACPYNISSGSVTIGPKKIPCDLNLSGAATITLTGPLWITGNISISNSVTMRVDPSLGKNSVAVVADNPSNRLSSSRIMLSNSAVFQGSGTAGSYVLLLSQNNAAETGGSSDKAISISNSVTGELILYAGHGEIELSNSINLREVTAYKIRTSNSAKIIYQTGLQNLLFSSGPGGGYEIERWIEVP